MSEKLSRRSFLKRTLWTLGTTAAIGSGGYNYANKLEPKWVEVTNRTLSHPQIPPALYGMTIAQFSDTHIGFQYTLQELENIVERITDYQPDLIVFTGDLLDEPNKYDNPERVVPILKKLSAPLGTFAIYGNHDHGGYGTDLYAQLMQQSGFSLLQNESVRIDANSTSFWMGGLDDAMLGRPDIKAVADHMPSDGFRLLLSHAPDVAVAAKRFGFHIQLSGHSHGGQVKLPFVGALVKPPLAEEYYEGSYEVGEGEPLYLYVNRGLGTTRLPFRFLARPELTFFTLDKEKR
ncbi:metallophosphoesterase [Bacillus fonticola]|uniref:metallophosphoesterase n=1 Tax=Bacillus fonticola TaxID=2728853 RepID=UPI001474D48D|nr:metallophosphoesterase [Bacillus fonticola]